MGTGHNIACLDCKVNYYLGYGGYANCIWSDTVEAYDADPRAAECRLDHNLNRRAVLVAHQGHKLRVWAEDDADWHGGNLYAVDYTYGNVLVEGYGEFERVDLQHDDAERAKLGIQASPFGDDGF